MIFNWKRLLEIVGLICAIIIIDLALHAGIGRGFPTDIVACALGILIIALAASPAFDFFMLKKKQKAMYPELKHRALEAAERKDGIIVKGDMGKMPSEWFGWFVKMLEDDGLAVRNPTNEKQILFPEIIAESRTEDEILEMGLPMDIGADILKRSGTKKKKKSGKEKSEE